MPALKGRGLNIFTYYLAIMTFCLTKVLNYLATETDVSIYYLTMETYYIATANQLSDNMTYISL